MIFGMPSTLGLTASLRVLLGFPVWPAGFELVRATLGLLLLVQGMPRPAAVVR